LVSGILRPKNWGYWGYINLAIANAADADIT
jgi:hypothetical protein